MPPAFHLQSQSPLRRVPLISTLAAITDLDGLAILLRGLRLTVALLPSLASMCWGLLTLYSFLRDPASLDSVCSPEDWSDLAISGATRFSRLAILVIDCFEIPNGHPQSRNPYTALIQISASWSCRSESPVSQTKTKNDSFMLPRPRRMSLLLPEIPLYQW